MISRLLTAALLIPLVLAAVFLFPAPVFLSILTLVLWQSLREFQGILAKYNCLQTRWAYLAVLPLPWVQNYLPGLLNVFLVTALLVLVMWALRAHRNVAQGLPSLAGHLLSLIYLGLPLTLLSTFHPGSPESVRVPSSGRAMLFVFLLIWISDAGAYFTGRLLGRRKWFRHLSPSKTLEGFAAGLVLPTLAAPVIGAQLLPGQNVLFLAVTGLVVAFFGIAGDLLESMFKRGAGIKDSSNLLPGHGGLLDRIDSLLLAFPAFWAVSTLLESSLLGR